MKSSPASTSDALNRFGTDQARPYRVSSCDLPQKPSTLPQPTAWARQRPERACPSITEAATHRHVAIDESLRPVKAALPPVLGSTDKPVLASDGQKS